MRYIYRKTNGIAKTEIVNINPVTRKAIKAIVNG